MAVVPKKESDIIALAEQMIAGLTEYTADFPTVTATSVQAPLDDYMEKKNAYECAKSQVNVTLAEKDAALAMLLDMMKADLKKAEVDVGPDSPKLSEIGWGPRQSPQPVPVPTAPTSLHSVAEGQGTLFLEWTRPAAGGAVRSYIVERCQEVPTGGYGPWTIAGSTYNCEINLAGQPMDVKLMYAVKAVNNSGESDPSNIVVVTLP